EMYADQPPYLADDIVKAFHFQSHPLGNSVLGSPESVSALTVEQMRDYFARQYSPGNIILAAAGKIDFDELCGLAEKYCGSWAPQATHREQIAPAPHVGLQSVVKPNSQQQYFIELANAPACRDPLRHAASLLTMIVGDDTGSRLFWELVDCGKAEHVVVSFSDYTDAGLFSTYMSCDPDVFEENLKAIRDVFREVEINGVTEAELAQAKNKVCSTIVLSGERPRSRLFKIGGSWAKRREYNSVKDVLAKVRAITLDDIRAVLDRYPLSAGSAIAVGPAEVKV
ncbi:MAG TPA: pitrilysin family protein, partial [Pirellulales bacterium]